MNFSNLVLSPHIYIVLTSLVEKNSSTLTLPSGSLWVNEGPSPCSRKLHRENLPSVREDRPVDLLSCDVRAPPRDTLPGVGGGVPHRPNHYGG